MPLFAFACSNKSDDATVTTTMPTRSPSIAVSPTSNSTVAGVQAPDVMYSRYVSDVCQATADFQADLSKFADSAFAKKVVNDPDTAFKDVATVFETFGTSLKKASPPPELQSWQDEAVARVDATAAALRSRNQSQLGRIFDSQLPAVPAGAQDQLKAAAQDNKECQRANLFR
jgi:hypothetical protein